MDTHRCELCYEPVDLTVDPCDETGNPVHEKCYFDRVAGKTDTAVPLPGLAMASNPALSAIAFV